MEPVKRVLIADADEAYRHGLCGIFDQRQEFVVVGSTGDGEDLLRLVQENDVDVIIMDVVLTGMDGIAVLEELGELEDDRLQQGSLSGTLLFYSSERPLVSLHCFL